MISYELKKKGTGAGVGWFSCIPADSPDFETALSYLKEHPLDDFMHRHALDSAMDFEPQQIRQLIERGISNEPVLAALTFEICLLNRDFSHLLEAYSAVDVAELQPYSPFIYIKWYLENGLEPDFFWHRVFMENANLHKPLSDLPENPPSLPFDRKELSDWRRGVTSIKTLFSAETSVGSSERQPPSRQFLKDLTRKLESLEILTAWEQRTEATLSPYAVERPWQLNISTQNERNAWSLSGVQTSYGRGLNMGQARISLLMEIVERVSAFASVTGGKSAGYKIDHAFMKARYSEMIDQNLNALNPNVLCLETAYEDLPLNWISAEKITADGPAPVWVPVQLVYLFCNLDEANLTSGISSTGLGAGFCVEEARLSALLEVIERDALRVVPFSKKRCFQLQSADPRVCEMLESLAQKGVHIQFADMTSEFGIPCYEAFVQGPGGVILKGTAAGLNGGETIISAATEIPYPYPYWFGSMPAPDGRNTLAHEKLPDFSTGDTAEDLARVEKVLLKNGYEPIYVDLTRSDLDIPVVRAIVPGLEMMAVLDRFAPLSKRQFAHGLEELNIAGIESQ